MGYTKIVQYGNITELYEYEKSRGNIKKPHISAIQKKRKKAVLAYARKTRTYKRNYGSIVRSLRSFTRLCHHNNTFASSVHFVTLTFAYDLTFKQASRYVSRFMDAIKKNYTEISISYISVSELTENGRYHFHLLVYDLPTETTERERKTRNFQRLFERGYIDICATTYITSGIAGYMAKYMAKTLADAKDETVRGYNCSRNIRRPYYAGSNTLNTHYDLILPDASHIEKKQYNTPYLGICTQTKIIK
jgi:hypothetical protein